MPSGARVTLGFAVHGGLVSAARGADLDGPAVARAHDGAIAIDEGLARFRGLDHVTVLVPGGSIVATGATFTVRVDARGLARVAVEAGAVSIERTGTSAAETLEASAATEVRAPDPIPRPTPVALNAPPPPAAAPAPSSNSVDEREARREAFTAAEIELANGEVTRARSRLEALLLAPEPSLAADAATLLARSFPVPADRAAAWARYLATSPPSPHRERAVLDRARALLDAGQPAEARGLLQQLSTSALGEAQKRQWERLSRDAERP